VIYFLTDENDPDRRLVNIGYSRTLRSRIDEVQAGGSTKPCPILAVEGTVHDAAAVQKLFALDHVRGDWYRASGRLVEHICDAVREFLPQFIREKLADDGTLARYSAELGSTPGEVRAELHAILRAVQRGEPVVPAS
jgi:hypothetical protein